MTYFHVRHTISAFYFGITKPRVFKPETVHKLITVQQDATLQSQCYHDYNLSKWTHEDELVKLDKDI